MRDTLYVRALPDWPGPGGKTYTAPERLATFTPVEADGHINFAVGAWVPLLMKGGLALAAQLRRSGVVLIRKPDGSLPASEAPHPQLQHFEMKVMEEPDEEDRQELALGGIPVERDGKIVERKADLRQKTKDAEKRAAEAEAENEKLKKEMEELKSAAIKALAPPVPPAEAPPPPAKE